MEKVNPLERGLFMIKRLVSLLAFAALALPAPAVANEPSSCSAHALSYATSVSQLPQRVQDDITSGEISTPKRFRTGGVCSDKQYDFVTDNWSGHVVPRCNLNCGYNFNWSELEFQMPAICGWCTPSPETEAMWTGTGQSNIVQAGCSANASGSTASYGCWTQNYWPNCNGACNAINESVWPRPNDWVYLYEQQSGSSCQYTIEDETTGQVSSPTRYCPATANASADFILELTPNGYGHYVPPFATGTGSGVNYFYADEASFGGSYGITDLTTNNQKDVITQYSSGANYLIAPSGVSNRGFYENWYSNGPTYW